MTKRIHVAYKKLQKRFGFSTLIKGHSLPKSGFACEIMSETETLRLNCSKILELDLLRGELDPELDLEDFIYLIRWLEENSINLGAYVFNKGNTDRYAFPKEIYNFLLNKRLKYIKEFEKRVPEKYKKGTNFIITTDKELLVIEELRVCIRRLESKYVRWILDPITTSDILSHIEEGIPNFCQEGEIPDEVDDNLKNALVRVGRMIRMEHILNSLSNYLWWYCQFIAAHKGSIREWENNYSPKFER